MSYREDALGYTKEVLERLYLPERLWIPWRLPGSTRGGTLVRLVHIQTMIVVDGWMALRIHCFSFFKISQTKTSPPQNSCTIRSMGQNRSFTLVKSKSPFVTLIIQCYSWCYLSKSRILLASTSLSTMTTPQRCGDNHDMILQIFKKSKFKKHNSKLHEMNKTLVKYRGGHWW